MSAGSASYSLSRGSTNSRIHPYHVHRSLAGPVALARTCVGLAGARATIGTLSPIAVMLGGAMQEENTGIPNT